MRILLAALMILLAGCLGALPTTDSESCPAAPTGQFATRIVWGFDPRQPSDELFRIDNLTEKVTVRGESQFGEAEPSSALLQAYGVANGTLFGSLRVEEAPASAPSYKASVSIEREFVADACWDETFFFKRVGGTSGVASVEGQLLEPGKGTHVLYAGFWTNGTLFGTNIVDLHESDWPRAGWYAWEGSAALPVYVYDQSRTEQPAYWKSAGAQVAATQRPGTPLDDALFETAGIGAATADSTLGLGYFTTIEGFNEALKGLSTNSARVVFVPAEKAYTLPGREDHILYGDDIVFLILARDVVPLPCPAVGAFEFNLPEQCATAPL